MKDIFTRLLTDFLSAIVFLVLYLTTGNVVLATCVAVAGAVAQVIYSRYKGQPLGFMSYAILAVVIVLGTATLLTNDPRFVLAKPAIGHFAIGAIMLKRGWMLRYMPPINHHSSPCRPGLTGRAGLFRHWA
jgi:intracellular septation protein